MAPSRGTHLCVLLDVGAVGVVEGAGAVFAAFGVSVTFLSVILGQLDGAAREIAEKVERLAERLLGGASESARGIHRDACIADRRRRRDQLLRGKKSPILCTGTGTSTLR